jgi:glycosyl transferase family 87
VTVAVRRLFSEPLAVGRLTLPPIGLVVAATVGAIFLLVVVTTRWFEPTDEAAYWRAAERLASGQPVYDATAQPGTPYAYFYPPPLAQILAPLTRLVDERVFTTAWTVLLLGCLWWLGGRRPLVAIALVAFVPVAVELWYRNVHLVLAALIVLGLRRAPWLFAVAAAIKVAPILGVLYLAVRGRWRDAFVASAVGGAILLVSVLVSPDVWRSFIDTVLVTGPSMGASLVPVPFPVRALIGVVLAVVAGRIPPRWGEPLLVLAIVVANPTLWATVFSMLVAIVPLLRTRSPDERPAPA